MFILTNRICEFNDTLITLVRNQKICKHLGSKLDDKGKQLFKPGYVLDEDFENTKDRNDTKGKLRPTERTKSDSLGSLRIHTRAHFWRAGQMKKFYVYLFFEALCLHTPFP